MPIDRSLLRNRPILMTYDFGRYAESEYLTWLNHKDVIIVGPAGYLQGEGKGAWIDTFDVVVRINHAIPIAFPEDYGSKTDVLYHIFSHRNPEKTSKKLIDQNEVLDWRDAHVKWVVSRHSADSQRIKQIAPIIDSLVPWCCMRHMFYEKLRRSIGDMSPNTGIAAIMHILSTLVRSLTVVGFDLYASGVYQGYGDVGENEDASKINDHWHSQVAQADYLRKIVRRDNRLIIDDHLRAVLQQ
jgi:hypothetical protein